ncbi:MAG TPA: four helix bundle protein [Planctomycetaceae bacterium]|nr:four helix bundle protein [Planctomycetaceae bacterium]
MTKPENASGDGVPGSRRNKLDNSSGQQQTSADAAKQREYDLEERTARFGEAIIHFAKRVRVNPVTERLIVQLVGAATSVGANYGEADDAGSKKEFLHRISLCKRESRESKHWLRMIVAAAPELKDEARVHWQEAKELNLIFGAIHRGKRGKP